MAFKLINPPYKQDNTPIYNADLEEGILGKANRNGSILLNKDLDPKEAKSVIEHESVHIDQMKRGDLDYDDDNVIWKGKKWSRAKMMEGAKNLPWEAEAYRKVKPKKE
jgi:hypothetical protein|tara:strand:+ start:678 stop:1001 length:324 start_codon:yes stop_codon:yes gene_type:complete